jgi:hypothetical protein
LFKDAANTTFIKGIYACEKGILISLKKVHCNCGRGTNQFVIPTQVIENPAPLKSYNLF